MKNPTIDDLLNSLQNPNKEKNLPNTKDTWSRIGNADSFEELGLSSHELNDFLKEWCENNPYSNL